MPVPQSSVRLACALLFGRRGAFSEELLGLRANVLVHLLLIEEVGIGAAVLRANDPLAVHEHHQWNQWALVGRPFQVLQRSPRVRGSDREGRLVLRDKSRNVGILVDGRFEHLKTLRLQLVFNATQDLSGFLAVRSSGQYKDQAKDLAAIVAHLQRLSTGELEHEIRGWPWDSLGAYRQAGKGRQNS